MNFRIFFGASELTKELTGAEFGLRVRNISVSEFLSRLALDRAEAPVRRSSESRLGLRALTGLWGFRHLR